MSGDTVLLNALRDSDRNGRLGILAARSCVPEGKLRDIARGGKALGALSSDEHDRLTLVLAKG